MTSSDTVAILSGEIASTHGEPLHNAVITLLSDVGNQVCRTVTSDDGAFQIQGLPPGRYTVVLSAVEHVPVTRLIVVTDDRAVALGMISLVSSNVPPAPQRPTPSSTCESARLEHASPHRASNNGSNVAPAVVVSGLAKSFGKVHALRGIDLTVPSGTVLGILGPNGAGKTTAIRILTTLLSPSAGTATVAGHDVARNPAAVRRVIGLAGQFAAVQEELTGQENLEIVGQLYHLGKRRARARAAELLERFELTDVAGRAAKTYSGGMQRRLDLAASLVGAPSVLFLDEPTTGLDPRSRLSMWQLIRDLASSGTTLVLTTQYLEEADELADQIVVIDRGLVIATGTAEELKNRVGGDVLEFGVADREDLDRAVTEVWNLGCTELQVNPETARISIPVGASASQNLGEVVRRLDAAGISPEGISVRRPSLDDVFLTLTGHVAETDAEEAEATEECQPA